MGVTPINPPFYAVTSKGHALMRTAQFTPTKSDSSQTCLSGYSDHPNYMSHTESSRAKAVGEPKKASYRGTQGCREVVMMAEFSEEIDNKDSPSSMQEVK
ncbi:hypothetical protein Tco_0274377, partial [Tanacetum coccineum]